MPEDLPWLLDDDEVSQLLGYRHAGAIPMTQAIVFSADDGCDVGADSGAPVSPDYGSRGNAFKLP